MLKRVLAILIVAVFVQCTFISYAVENIDPSTGQRIKAIQDKLAALTEKDVEKAVSKYPDMAKHWSKTYAGKLTCLEIITGLPDGNFKPDKPLQVDHFIKMCISAMGLNPEKTAGYWAQPYIDLALQNGIVQKSEFTNYTKSITREQMARLIVRLALLVDTDSGDKYDQYITGKLKDYGTVTEKLRSYVIDAYKLGLFAYGKDGKFRPKESLTRAEGCVVILKFLDSEERTPLLPNSDEIITCQDLKGNTYEMYPGAIREYFDVAKALKKAILKAKGYVDFGFSTKDGHCYANLYKDETAFRNDMVNMIGTWDISPETPENKNNPDSTVYRLTVYDDTLYKSLFADYSHEVIKTIFGKDANKATVLHDKYMNMRNNTLKRIWEETRLNTRKTGVFRDNTGFSFSASVLGKK
jgi:S-layer homology domain.